MCKIESHSDSLIKSRTSAKKLKIGKYTDAPRFKVIYGYEDDFKNSFKRLLIEAQKEMITLMSKMQ